MVINGSLWLLMMVINDGYWLVPWNIWIIFPFHIWDVILPMLMMPLWPSMPPP
jgi:hypothetical protein